jgi:hypothetical protein
MRRIWNDEHPHARAVRLLRIANWGIPFFLGCASFLLYLKTLAPDVVDADGGEFQFAAWNFGFVHPTGYPLYLILGGLFQHLCPLGNPAFRLNLFTALTASLAVAMLYLAVKELTHHRGAAMFAAALFTVTRAFWYDASAAETYALNAFFLATLIYLALRWQAAPTANKFVAFCAVYGLAFTHHRTIMLWMPAFLFFFFLVAHHEQFRFHPERIGKQFGLFALAFALPFLLYLYIPLRAPASPYATLALAPGHALVLYDNSFAGFIDYFLGRTFQSELRWDATSVERLVSVPQFFFDQFGIMGVALGVFGFIAMIGRREWAQFLLLFTGFITTIVFASFYHIGDIFHYYIPAYVVWATWIGIAVGWFSYAMRNTQLVMRVAYCIILVGLMAAQLIANFPYADRSRETQARAQWSQILSTPMPANAILISNDRDEMMPLWYIQYVENTRRDIAGLFPLITPAYSNVVRVTDSVLNLGRPLYFIKPMPGLEIKYRLENATPLVRVIGSIDRTPQKSTNASIADRVRVIGYDAVREANQLHVAIYWQAQAKLPANYTTFVHLLDANGNKIAQGSDHQVGGDFYPTSLWQIGETLRDEFIIAAPVNLSNGPYQVLAGMYRSSDSEMLGAPVIVSDAVFP